MNKQLKHLIDTQDNEGLIEFLQNNPEIDLRNIAASGVSALWWALTPPSGSSISLAIVETLLRVGEVDPFEVWQGVSVRSLNNRELTNLVARYEANLIRDENYELDEDELFDEEREEDDLLANLGNDDQNVHDAILVRRYDYHIACLFKRYVTTGECQLYELPSDITKFIQDNFSVSDLNSARSAIERCHDSSDVRTQSDFASEKGTITYNNINLMTVIWHALNDTRPENYVPGVEFDLDSIVNRKKLFIEHLIATQHEYGDNSPACFMGTRSKLITSLEYVHVDCAGEPPFLVTKEYVEELYQEFCGEVLIKLQQENPRLFGFFLETLFEPINDNSDKEHLEHELANWEDSIFKDFFTQTKESLEKKCLTPTAIEELLKPYTRSENPFLTIAHNKNEFARIVSRCAEKINILNRGLLPTPTSELDFSSLPTFKSLIFKRYGHVTPNVNEAFKEIFHDYGFEKENVPEALWKEVIEQIYLGNTINLESIFIKFYSTQFDFGPWKEWYNNLPNSYQKIFFKRYHEVHNIQECAYEVALDSGCWDFYQAQANYPVIINKQDLRGHSFNNVDLQFFTFIECDLRIAGIVQNRSEQPGPIINSNMDMNALTTMVHENNVSLFRSIYTHLSIERKIQLFEKQLTSTNLLYQSVLFNKLEFLKIILSDKELTSEAVWQNSLFQKFIDLFRGTPISLEVISACEEFLGKKRIMELYEVIKQPKTVNCSYTFGLNCSCNTLVNLALYLEQLEEILFINNTSLLILAVCKGDIEATETLLKQNNKELLYFKDSLGNNALSYAASLKDSPQILNLLLAVDNSYEFIHSYNNQKMLPIYFAATDKNTRRSFLTNNSTNLSLLLEVYKKNNYSLSNDEYILLLKHATSANSPNAMICEMIICYGNQFLELNKPSPLCNGYIYDLFEPLNIRNCMVYFPHAVHKLALGYAHIGKLDGLIFWVETFSRVFYQLAHEMLSNLELQTEEPVFYLTLKLFSTAYGISRDDLRINSLAKRNEVTFDFLRLVRELVQFRSDNFSSYLLNVFINISDSSMRELATSHVRNSGAFDSRFKAWFMREMQGLSSSQGLPYNPLIATFSHRFFPSLERVNIGNEVRNYDLSLKGSEERPRELALQ